MKKTIVLLLSLFMMTALLAAGGKAEGEKKQASDAKPVVIQIGHESNPGEPVDLSVNEWKRILEDKSKGTMQVKIYPASQLGSKNNIIDQMQAGLGVITLADGAFYADRGVPDFGIQFAPYLFADMNEALKLPKTSWWKEQVAKLEQKGLKILTANWIYGARHTLTKKPVRKVADLKGMKIRTPTNTIQIKSFEVLGAAPTPMTLSEVYTALQQGVIDGVENPLHILYNGRFYEVAKYLILDGHIMNVTSWLTGTKFFSTLTPDQKNLLMSTGDEAGLFNNKIQENLFDSMLKKLKEAGVEVITDVNLKEFQEASKAFYSLPEIKSKWTPGLFETVTASLKEVK